LPWKARPLEPVEQDNAQLRTLRRQLQTKQSQVGGLKLALQQRHQTIDALNGKLEQVRAQNRRLDAECEQLVELVRLSPP
jgi:chromosome segregation ATPase